MADIELISAIKGIGVAFDEFKGVNDKRLDKLEKRIDDITDRVESREAMNDPDRPRPLVDHVAGTRYEREHKSVFCEWLRRPLDGNAKRRLDEAQNAMRDSFGEKAVTIATPSAGGYAVPALIDREIESRVRTLNPFRGLVREVSVGSRDYRQLVSKSDSSSGWVGEGDARAETTTSELLERAPTFGTLYAYPKASEEALQDVFFDVGQWLIEEAGDGFAAAEASAIVNGDGSKKPTGFLHATPSSLPDQSSPERAAGALMYIAPTATSPTSLLTYLGDALINCAYSVKDKYLQDSAALAWVMRRSTGALVRRLKEATTGQYLWQSGLAAGQPDTLLGYPVRYSDAMPQIANDAHPIAFGNWRRGYLLADRVGSMEITVDSNITTPGQTRFYLRRTVGGCVLNHEALRVIKVSD